MAETTFDFLDSFSVEIRGSGSAYQKLVEYYRSIPTCEDSNPDLTCIVEPIEIEPDEVLGGSGTIYGRSGNWYVIRKEYAGSIKAEVHMNRGWDVIRCAPQTTHYFVAYLIEYAIRRQLVEDGVALIHGSGVRHGETGYVFPAWRHTGKTNTMLSFVLEGADYISDDRVWIGSDGTVRGYPLPINMLPYNYRSFPSLDRSGHITEAKRVASDRVSEWVDGRDSVVAKALYFMNQFYLEPSGETRRVEDLLPESQYVDETQLDRLVFLQTVPEKGMDSLVSEKLSEREAARTLQAISRFEWNERMQRFAAIHDMLFPESEKLTEYNEFEETERDVFEEATRGPKCYKLYLPREEKWTEKNLTSELRSTIKRL